MTRILDYNALFSADGRQKNICTDPNLGGSYQSCAHSRAVRRTSALGGAPSGRRTPAFDAGSRTAKQEIERPTDRWSDRRPVRCIDFDSFDNPDRTAEEARESLQKSAILFGSALTAVVAIAILL